MVARQSVRPRPEKAADEEHATLLSQSFLSRTMARYHTFMNERMAILAIGLLLPAVALAGQSDCADGIVRDDGTFELAFLPSASVSSWETTMRVSPPPGLQRLQEVCVCWTRPEGGQDPGLQFAIKVYSEAPDGSPGALIDSLPMLEAVAVPQLPQTGFFSYDVSVLAIDTNERVFVGVEWDPSEFSVGWCMDTNGPGGEPAYISSLQDPSPHRKLGPNGIDSRYRALGIRAKFLELAPPEPCEAGGNTLCIDDEPDDGRFEIETEFSTSQAGGLSGFGQAVPLTALGISRGGLMTFFSPDNPEMLIKVLDGCGINGHKWVFYTAGTNVGLETTVIDTQTRRAAIYLNPDLEAAPPVQDLMAFPCDGSDGPVYEAVAAAFDFENDFERSLAGAPSSCVPDMTTLCIDDQPGDKRFQINVDFETTQAGGVAGSGQVLALASVGVARGGLMTFFSGDNPEMLIKVLDGCGINGKKWVFYTAGTNVGFETTVVDTQTGESVTYCNTDLNPAPPLQHLQAFDCP